MILALIAIGLLFLSCLFGLWVVIGDLIKKKDMTIPVRILYIIIFILLVVYGILLVRMTMFINYLFF
jgi:succinate dehydrogenase hydrophobic anchor subunit